MKVLFLDIDGVLNCAKTFEERHRHDAIESAMVQRINDVVQHTGCKIVISSSWRHWWQLDELTNLLHDHGLRADVIDFTPKLKGRGKEILAWLADHPEVTCFAAIDDDDFDMADVSEQLVKTSFVNGTQQEHVDALVALLTKPV